MRFLYEGEYRHLRYEHKEKGRYLYLNIDKQPQETPLDYHKRLIYGKLVDRTLSDIDYTELSERVYGQAYSSDVARRMMYGSKRTLELLDNESRDRIKDSEMLSELDSKLIDLRKESQRFYDQRREYNKLVTIDARYEHLISELCNSAKALPKTIGCLYNNDSYINFTGDTSDSEAVLVLSDWHYGLKTDNAFNSFNTMICKERVINIAEKAARKIALHKCSKLHIVVLGDLIHGAIHTSARVASEELVCDQLMQATELLAQTIERLSICVPETYVYVTYGNHARTIPSKNENVHRDNMERLVPWWLTPRLSIYDNIHIMDDTGNEFLFIDACGHQICAAHGDNDSVKSSPRLLTTLFQKKYGKNIEYVLLGDKHHRESFEELGITSMLCGALCGADDYANGKRLYSTPSQLLLIMNEADGLDAEYRLKCDN
jgi:hypothetical protein